jgi:hypothetical protein
MFTQFNTAAKVKPPGVAAPDGSNSMCVTGTSTNPLESQLTWTRYTTACLTARRSLRLMVKPTLQRRKATDWRRRWIARSTGQCAISSEASEMKNSNVTEMLAVTIRLHGRDADRVIVAAGYACKTPEQYLTDMAKWNGRMAGEGAA